MQNDKLILGQVHSLNFSDKSNFLDFPPTDVHLIFEKTSLKNQVERAGIFANFKLDFLACSLQKSS